MASENVNIAPSELRRLDVGIGEMRISDNPRDLLVAPNLGSCLGIAVYDANLNLGGLIHCLLPLSKSDPAKAKENPCLYVDTGAAVLLNEILGRGAEKKKLKIYVVGGSNINDTSNVFEIGKRNYTVLRKVLWKNKLLISGEDVGGSISRTLSLNIGTGEVFVKASDYTKELTKRS